MGHRALVGTTQEDGTVQSFYSHWGAMNAYGAGKDYPEAPKKDGEREIFTAKNAKEFAKKHVDFLHHEAVWLDGKCYAPLWVFPSSSIKCKDWKTEGQGVLIECSSGEEFNQTLDYNAAHLIDDITDLSKKNKIKLMLNHILGHLSCNDTRVPSFSPMGYKKECQITRELFASFNE